MFLLGVDYRYPVALVYVANAPGAYRIDHDAATVFGGFFLGQVLAVVHIGRRKRCRPWSRFQDAVRSWDDVKRHSVFGQMLLEPFDLFRVGFHSTTPLHGA